MTKTAAILSTILICAGLTAARSIETVDRTIEAEGAKKLDITIDFAAGELTIDPEDMSEAAKLHLEYDTRRVDYDIDYKLHGSTGSLYMETERLTKRDIDTEDNLWDLKLSKRYPIEMEMDIGACDAKMELGGLPLVELSLDVGAASGVIEFSDKNPERLRMFSVDAGAASVEINNIGNSGFEEFDFDGGAGSFELDFRGDNYEGLCEVTIDIGLGSCELTLPKGIPVQITSDDDGWFSSIDFHGDDLEEVDDGVWESDDFENARTSIALDLDVGMGSIDIYFK
ncbi:MAG TPA: toast rack family protein [candidate division Zixibacteria bacterium]|nr:toast rack family protein [candidate division Zixibacteria bacterium]